MCSMNWTGRPIGDRIINRLKNLLGVFVAAVLYFALVYHLTNLYGTENHGVERFILLDGGIYTKLFWVGQVLVGGIIPLALLFSPLSRSRPVIALASVLVIIGGLAQMYVIIIGGQAFPLLMFPGMEVSSAFQDGTVAEYSPSIWEVLLGLGGVAVALAATMFAMKVLPLLPATLADADVDPHHKEEVPAEEASPEAA
jgi:Ni/Fe-hydrogenase subunit HybB-like protein